MHLSADDAHRRLRSIWPNISLTTVYRTLNRLTDAGVLARSASRAGRAVYALQRERQHDQLLCLECGRVDEFFDALIDERKAAIARASGYALARQQPALCGACSDCRK